jgi:hypothetical protein
MSELLDQIAAQEESAAEEARLAFREIVRNLASGNSDPELREVQAVLKALGKTSDDLRRAVGALHRRQVLQASLRKAEQAEQDYIALRDELQTLGREFEEQRKGFIARISPMESRLQQLAHEMSTRSGIAQQLQRDCKDAGLLSRLAQVRRHLNGVHRALKEKLQLQSTRKARLDDEKAKPRPGSERKWLGKGEGLGGDPEIVAKREEQLAEVTAEVERLRSEQAALLDLERDILLEMIEG